MISHLRPKATIASRIDMALLSNRRPEMAPSGPSLASAMAVAAPIPRVPPVTKATLPAKFMVMPYNDAPAPCKDLNGTDDCAVSFLNQTEWPNFSRLVFKYFALWGLGRMWIGTC